MIKIDEDILDTYYQLFSSKFLTGMDKITAENFYSDKSQHFSVIINKYNSGTYKFTKLKRIQTPKGRIICIPTIRDRLTIEILKTSLQKKFRIRFPDRNNIISNLISLFSTNTPYTVIRLDIKSFFASIPHNKLLHKLKNSSLLDYEEYELVKKILKLEKNNIGIPQGISLSNILSEIYLEEFDYNLRKLHLNLAYYNRYVDDIIIIINGIVPLSEQKITLDNIEGIFKKSNLQKNISKSDFLHFYPANNSNTFSYLGYNFKFQNKQLVISMDKNKYQQHLAAIDYYFNQFSSHHNCNLLVEQLKFLTSKKTIFKLIGYRDSQGNIIYKNRKIFFGVLENYKEVTTQKNWNGLDNHIRKKIHVFLHTNQINDKKIERMLYSISFSKNIEQNNIYKLNKMTRLQLISVLKKIDNEFQSYFEQCGRIFLFKRYFKLMKIK